MALRAEFVSDHIQRWVKRLDGGAYPHRKRWPEYLFHHAPIENAVLIASSGAIRSRNDPENLRRRDVAAREVNQVRNHAHDYVRLYFRPKTPTQYNIEGIRKPGECQFGEETHAPILVMFALDAFSILTQPDIRFSDRNMQRQETETGSSEDYFSKIPFEKVFHEGPTGGDSTIKWHRCAEVLTRSPLDLKVHLKNIIFRSIPERDTFIHKVGNSARSLLLPYCRVSDNLLVFEKKYSFFRHMSLCEDGVVFNINQIFDGENIGVRISIYNKDGNHIKTFSSSSIASSPDTGNWIYKINLKDDVYLIKGWINDQLAYEAPISLENSLF